MKIYSFPQFKVQIQNPVLEVVGVNDNFNGSASIDIELSLGAQQGKAAIFGVTLEGFTYSKDWTQADVQTWVENELTQYEI